MAQLPGNCNELTDLLGAYSIGATTPAENRAIERLLADCPEAAAELADYMAVRDALSLVAAAQDAPGPSRDLLAGIDLDMELARDHTPPAVAPTPQPPTERDTQTMARLTPPAPQPKIRHFPVAAWYAFGSVAAALILVFGLLTVVNSLLVEMRAERAQLIALVEASSNAPREVIQVMPTTASVQSVRRLEHAHHIQLTPAINTAQTGQADVIWDPETGVGTLSVTAMPTLPDGTRYQMWLVNNDQEISVGLFQVDADGSGFLVFQSPEPLTAFEVIGISVEPSTGSVHPTTPHLVTGQI
jgi:hypothetical protein